MIEAIPVPADNADVRTLPAIVAKLARFANAWRSNSVTTPADASTGVDISESNVVVKVPPSTGGTGGGGGLGPVWIVVNVDSEPEYMQVNANAPVAALPPGASVVNPD